MEAQIDALQDGANASSSRKAETHTRIADGRINYERRAAKLKQALELAKEALSSRRANLPSD
jgi:hypothetical protein